MQAGKPKFLASTYTPVYIYRVKKFSDGPNFFPLVCEVWFHNTSKPHHPHHSSYLYNIEHRAQWSSPANANSNHVVFTFD